MPITAGVIDLFSVPPPDQLAHSVSTPVVMPNPLSGSGLLAVTSGGVSAFGIHWIVSDEPPGAGKSTRAVTVYEQPFLSFVLFYTLADASFFIGDRVLTGDSEGFYLFQLAAPSTLKYDILPGWRISADWLVAP